MMRLSAMVLEVMAAEGGWTFIASGAKDVQGVA